MKIVSLTAENVKKLTAIEITPSGNMVEITGKNGAGKTSVLDSIWWCIAGAEHIQTMPVRKGATEAFIKLDLGTIKVTRTFKIADKVDKKTGEVLEEAKLTTAVVIETEDGARFPTPQRMLDDLFGQLTFDPLGFSRMKPEDQLGVLRGFVPDVDFSEIETANKEDFKHRTDINRDAKSAAAAAGLIVLPDDCPTEAINERLLVDELQEAGESNAELERRKQRRADAQGAIEAHYSNITVSQGQINELKSRIAEIEAYIVHQEGIATELQKKLDEAPPLPDPIDIVAIRARLESAKDTNQLVERARRKAQFLESVANFQAAADALTNSMQKRTSDMEDKVKTAKMPIEGLGLGDGFITFNGLPFNQASDAERLRVSVAMAMAMNPKLRVIRIRDGSLLDEEAMALLAKMADEADYQCWIERVDSSGKIGFVIEDGHLKEQGT